MMFQSFSSDDFEFKNYIDCSKQEHEIILHWRNDENIRIWMNNQNPISFENHLKFVQSLINCEDKAYYAVFKKDIYIGSIYIMDIFGESCERGLFVIPSNQGKGQTMQLEKEFLEYIYRSGLRTIKAEVKIDNIRSNRYHLKMGYKEIGRDESFVFYNLILN